MAIALPQDWSRTVASYPSEGGPSGQEWLEALPRLLAQGLERWDLTPDGVPRTGHTALVLPVRRGGEQLVLKVAWPHPESAAEHLALRAWAGHDVVRLVAAHPSDGLLLLERLEPDHDLREVWSDEACAIIGRLLASLATPAPPRVPGLAEYLEPHLARMQHRDAVPRRVLTRTLALARELLTDLPNTLLHTDLHYENVLRSHDGRWVVIDPKPLSGHPGFELFPALRNRADELGTGAELRWSVRHRLGLLADAAGIDLETARAWTVLRSGIEVSWATVDPGTDDGSLCVAIGKALDD
jgi:streptomycin 6-kinase